MALIAAPVHPVLAEGLKDAGYTLRMAEKITPETAGELIADCTGLITSVRLSVNRPLIDSAPGLKWIGRMGSGMEIIDTAYARQKGIACFSSPEGNCNAVAEHALGMLLSLTKRINWGHREIGQGLWRREPNRGMELEGRTIGIIGFGHTGSAFAKKLQGFDMRILAFDTDSSVHIPAYAEAATLEQILREAEIISFHVPLTGDTHGYFNRDFTRAMQNPFILINTSRGKVVDTEAALEGLESGKIRGLALDVLDTEPLGDMGDALRKRLLVAAERPEVVLTPHIAGYSGEALYKMSKALLDKIIN